jgi:hypothetical protein
MFWNWFGLTTPPALSDFDGPLPREELILKGRMAIIDDEEPLLLDHIRKSGFAIDHDRDGKDLRNHELQLYDVQSLATTAWASILGWARFRSLEAPKAGVAPHSSHRVHLKKLERLGIGVF